MEHLNQVPFLTYWKQVVLVQTKSCILHGILQKVQQNHLIDELF